jgi:hypothetical protein
MDLTDVPLPLLEFVLFSFYEVASTKIHVYAEDSFIILQQWFPLSSLT